MQKMLCFSDKKLNITEQIGVNYFAFGTFLVEDSNGVTVKALEMNIFGMRPCNINYTILQRWLCGTGLKPVSDLVKFDNGSRENRNVKLISLILMES